MMSYQVNLYIYSSINRPNKKKGTVIYVLEMLTAHGAATFTNKLSVENSTLNESLLHGLCEALSHITKPSDVTIYTTSWYIYRGINDFLPKWAENGYKNTRYRPILYEEKWRLTRNIPCIASLKATLEENQYLVWMKSEVEADG